MFSYSAAGQIHSGKDFSVISLSFLLHFQYHQEDQLFRTGVSWRSKGKLWGFQRKPEPHGIHQQFFQWQKEQWKVRGIFLPVPAVLMSCDLSSPEVNPKAPSCAHKLGALCGTCAFSRHHCGHVRQLLVTAHPSYQPGGKLRLRLPMHAKSILENLLSTNSMEFGKLLNW